MLYPPFAPSHPIGLASGLSAVSVRIPIPGGGEAIYTSAGINNYRHPNWQGSQVLTSCLTQTTPTVGGAFTPFGEKYATYSGGTNGYFAGMLGIADEGGIPDAYQAEARLLHQAEGRWISPDPAGLGAVDLSNPQTWNCYAYVVNDPLNNIDPSGLGNCEAPLYWLPNPNGDGGACVSGNPSTSRVFLGSCMQAMVLSGGGYPCGGGATAFQQVIGQNGAGQSIAANNNRQPNKITCGTVLPNGRTVGSYVKQLSNSINGTDSNSVPTPYGPSPNPSAPGPIFVASQVYSGTNFRGMFGKGAGYTTNAFLGDSGNFAYAAVSANIAYRTFQQSYWRPSIP